MDLILITTPLFLKCVDVAVGFDIQVPDARLHDVLIRAPVFFGFFGFDGAFGCSLCVSVVDFVGG